MGLARCSVLRQGGLRSGDVVHDINQGERQVGKPQFTAFLKHMEECYSERLENIVIMESADNRRS